MLSSEKEGASNLRREGTTFLGQCISCHSTSPPHLLTLILSLTSDQRVLRIRSLACIAPTIGNIFYTGSLREVRPQVADECPVVTDTRAEKKSKARAACHNHYCSQSTLEVLNTLICKNGISSLRHLSCHPVQTQTMMQENNPQKRKRQRGWNND